MKKEDKVTDYPNSLETRVALVEMSIININQTLIRLEKKIDDGFNKIENQITDIKKEMKNDFRWLLTIIAGLGAIMGHGFHWF